jgi:hypothetical protein
MNVSTPLPPSTVPSVPPLWWMVSLPAPRSMVSPAFYATVSAAAPPNTSRWSST